MSVNYLKNYERLDVFFNHYRIFLTLSKNVIQKATNPVLVNNITDQESFRQSRGKDKPECISKE